MLLSLLLAHHQPAEADAEAAPSMPRWVKPGSAGAGYASKTLRVPRWTPTFDMAKSTVAMPCNYSGYYDVGSLHDFGYLQFDWSNRKDAWCQDKPMTCSESIANQSAAVHAASASASSVYQHDVVVPFEKSVRWNGPIYERPPATTLCLYRVASLQVRIMLPPEHVLLVDVLSRLSIVQPPSMAVHVMAAAGT